MTDKSPEFEYSPETLPEPALQLLEAARQLAVEGGWEALRVESISKAAGKNKASIKYYFENKDGLVSALVSLADYKRALDLAARVKDAENAKRLDHFLESKEALLEDKQDSMMFVDLLPHVLRDDKMRERLDALYDWYREMTLSHLGVRREAISEDDTRALASLLLACTDGLAIQSLLRPGTDDVVKALHLLRRLLQGQFNLRTLQGGDTEDEHTSTP